MGCVGATIGRPPTWRSIAFSGVVFLQGKRARASNARPYGLTRDFRVAVMSRAGRAPPLPCNDFCCRTPPKWFGVSDWFVGNGLDRSVPSSRQYDISGNGAPCITTRKRAFTLSTSGLYAFFWFFRLRWRRKSSSTTTSTAAAMPAASSLPVLTGFSVTANACASAGAVNFR